MPYEDYLKQLLSMEIAYNNILRRTKDLAPPYAMPYENYLKQLLSMEIAYNNILRRIWHLPMQCHTRILHLTAGLHSLVNRTMSLKSTLLKRSCCTDSVLIKHLLSRYSIVPQLAIIYVITGLLRPCLEKFNRFIYSYIIRLATTISYLLPYQQQNYIQDTQCNVITTIAYNQHYTTHFHLKRAGTSIKNIENEKNR